MLIVATFKHSAYVELALKLLEQKGFTTGDLLAAPLDKQPRDDMNELNAVHKDGKSPYDIAFIFAMIFMLLGAIYGFVLPWGPIIWSVIGIGIGAICGLAVDTILGKNPFRRRDTESEVVLIIHCTPERMNIVERILWNHRALGISKISSYPSQSDS